ncbi:hypothetical protein HY572_04270 [Candidatus Micrarchaeota archaeon]|nr:hypothetical protein [Candidatus Micrarchaeota archaeon]
MEHEKIHSFFDGMPFLLPCGVQGGQGVVHGQVAYRKLPGRPDLPRAQANPIERSHVLAALLAERIYHHPTAGAFVASQLGNDWHENISELINVLRGEAHHAFASGLGLDHRSEWHDVLDLIPDVVNLWPQTQEHGGRPPGGGGPGGGDGGGGHRSGVPPININIQNNPVNEFNPQFNPSNFGNASISDANKITDSNKIQDALNPLSSGRNRIRVEGGRQRRRRRDAPPQAGPQPPEQQVIEPLIVDADFRVQPPQRRAFPLDSRRAALPLPLRAFPGPQRALPLQSQIALPESTPTHDHGPQQAQAIDPNAPAPLAQPHTPEHEFERHLGSLLAYYAHVPHRSARLDVVQHVWGDPALRTFLHERPVPPTPSMTDERVREYYQNVVGVYHALPTNSPFKEQLGRRLLHGLVTHVSQQEQWRREDLTQLLRHHLHDTNLAPHIQEMSVHRMLPVLHMNWPQSRALAHDLARYLVWLGFNGPLPR